MDALLTVLRTYKDLAYTVRETRTTRTERYIVRRDTEMNREADVRHIHLTVFKVFEEDGVRYRGSYTTEIHPTADESEMRASIEQGLFAAGFVKNAYYPLVTPEEAVLPGESSNPDARQLAQADEMADADEALGALQRALYENDHHEQGRICYAEVFVSRNDTRIVNSNGVDVRYADSSAYVETAVPWRGEDGSETEFFESYRFGGGGEALLRERVARLFTVAEQKSKARPTPVLKDVDVLLTGECLKDFFGYYRSQTDAQFLYRKLSILEPGQDVQQTQNESSPDNDKNAHGDRITLTLEPYLPGSVGNRPYDGDGRALERHVVIDHGVFVKPWGGTRFAHYLGVTSTGDVGNTAITGGASTEAELRAQPYIELLSFSAFQTDAVTGDFGGEIRLGFYFDGHETVPVTGGSISGNIKQVQAGLRMSVEQRQYDNFCGPAAVRLSGVSVAGVEA